MVTVPPPSHAPPVTSSFVNGAFLFREDESLKQYIQGHHVVTFDQSSVAGGRVLPVYFRNGETELRTRQYPFILIDRLPSWSIDHSREQRGPYRLKALDAYAPDGTDIEDGSTTVVRQGLRTPLSQPPANADYTAQELPIPVNVQYQVSAWTRFKEQMLWIENQMGTQVFPPRFGAINMAPSNYARDDNSVRCLDLLGVSHNDMPDPENAGKRLFGRVWTVQMSSELLPSDLERAVGPRVARVLVDPSDRSGYDSVT